MTAKDRFPRGYHGSGLTTYESEGSGSSGRVDTEVALSENSVAPRRKWINLNAANKDGFAVPVEILSLARLSPSEKKTLIYRLRSELEQIRVLQKKFELRRTNPVPVSSSSDILSCSNAQKGPIMGNLKKPSALTPKSVKKSNPSAQKARGWNRGTSGRFESLKQAPTSNSCSMLMKQCESLLKKLMTHQFGWVFNEPVDAVKLNIPDYFTVIKHPMDLGTIKSKLASGQYSSPFGFLADVRLTFSNAKTYNPPGNDVHKMADAMSKFFESKWKSIDKRLPSSNSEILIEQSDLQDERETVGHMSPSKKRKYTPAKHIELPEPVKRKMTDEEKHNLSRELEDMQGDLPDDIIEFLKEQSSNGLEAGEEEIEIEIDALSDDTLFKLRKLIDDHLLQKQRSAEADRCEIELPNESGLSNSSMQPDKGNGPTEEDVDIGGNEPPVSSHHRAETEEDMLLRNNEYAAVSSRSASENEAQSPKDALDHTKNMDACPADFDGKTCADDLVDSNQSISGLDQLEPSFLQKPTSVESDINQDEESAPPVRQVSPEKLYRAALLKNRFADTILKAREKTLCQGEKADPETLRREKEELEMQRRKEKARLQAEAKAAEEARRRAEAEAAAEAKRKRELEREAARQALLKMEKTVEINENSRFLEDLEMLTTAAPDQLPSSVDETSPDHSQDGLGSFKFGSSNPLEQLGLFIKADDEDEECEPPSLPKMVDDVEEGEID